MRFLLPHGLDGVILAAVAAILYIALGQDTLYKIDAHLFLWRSLHGDTGHPYHTFYLPVLAGLRSLLEPLGFSLYEVARLLSAVGMAVGVALSHAASRYLVGGRRDSLVVAGLVAVCPAVVFFATVVEVHGLFFAFAGIGFLALAHLARRRSVPAAALVGVALGLCFLAHPTGALMLGLLPWVCLSGGGSHAGRYPLRSLGLHLMVAAAVLFLLILALPPLLQDAGSKVDAGFSVSYLLKDVSRLLDPVRTFEVIQLEWFWPLLPCSILAPVACFRLRDPRIAVAAVLATAPYIATCQLMFDGYDEAGAYLLPLSWPLALLSGRFVRRPATVAVALAVGLGFGVRAIRVHDDPTLSRALAQGVEQVADGHPVFWLLGEPIEMEAFFVHDVKGEAVSLGDVVTPTLRVPFDRILDKLDEVVRAREASGLVVLISRDALDSLLRWSEQGRPWGRLLRQHLFRRYRLIPVAAEGFRGFLVQSP